MIELDRETALFLDNRIAEAVKKPWESITDFGIVLEREILVVLEEAIEQGNHILVDRALVAREFAKERPCLMYLMAEQRKAGEESWIIQRTSTSTPPPEDHTTGTKLGA